jgi:hypothetical protein
LSAVELTVKVWGSVEVWAWAGSRAGGPNVNKATIAARRPKAVRVLTLPATRLVSKKLVSIIPFLPFLLF